MATIMCQNDSRSTRTHTSAHTTEKTKKKRGLNVGVGADLDDCHLFSLRRLAHYYLQIPMYFVKWPYAVLLGIWSALFWRTPTSNDIVALVEGTSLITVLRRGLPPESMKNDQQQPEPSETKEERHYYIDVKKCLLEHVTREPGSTYEEGEVLPVKSWSMSYTKSCPLVSGDSASDTVERRWGKKEGNVWEVEIRSFIVNGKQVPDPASQLSVVQMYLSASTHVKSHVFGNTLSRRIRSDPGLQEKMPESTWSTTWLHDGLLNGSLGPGTETRTTANKWMGLGSVTKRQSLVAESTNMSTIAGAGHASHQCWADLQLPFADFLVGARKTLIRVMLDNDIPMDLLEAIFLSVIVHSVDHVNSGRIMWGLRFKLGFDWDQPPTMHDFCESTAWNAMWITPTINPLYHNKIRRISRPFYRQLYQGLKKIDTLNLADQVTASILY